VRVHASASLLHVAYLHGLQGDQGETSDLLHDGPIDVRTLPAACNRKPGFRFNITSSGRDTLRLSSETGQR
jgi:hypothetical protein